jgi:hypothetical protein
LGWELGCLPSSGLLWRNGAGGLASVVADPDSAQSVVARGDRLLPLVSGSGNRAREYWGGQTPSLVVGAERRLIGGFVLTLKFLPELGFMFLLLPLFPPLMGILSLVAGLLNRAWVYAIGSALFFGLLLAAGFPLSA